MIWSAALCLDRLAPGAALEELQRVARDLIIQTLVTAAASATATAPPTGWITITIEWENI